MDERAVVTDDSQDPSRPESEVAGSHKSAASSEKSESEPSESGHSPPSAVSPRSKRKRDEVEDSGTSKPRSLLPKKRHPRKRVPSTLTTTQAPLARKLLHCHYLFRCSFFYLHTHLSVLIVARKKRKKKPRFMVRLSRVPPKPWFSPKIAVLPRNPRLPLNKTWKPRHLQLAPEPPHRKEQGLRLAIVMRLSRGVPRLLLWTM